MLRTFPPYTDGDTEPAHVKSLENLPSLTSNLEQFAFKKGELQRKLHRVNHENPQE